MPATLSALILEAVEREVTEAGLRLVFPYGPPQEVQARDATLWLVRAVDGDFDVRVQVSLRFRRFNTTEPYVLTVGSEDFTIQSEIGASLRDALSFLAGRVAA